MTDHVSAGGLDADANGWVYAVCSCGNRSGPYPDEETAIDALMGHAAAESGGIARRLARQLKSLRDAVVVRRDLRRGTSISYDAGYFAACERELRDLDALASVVATAATPAAAESVGIARRLAEQLRFMLAEHNCAGGGCDAIHEGEMLLAEYDEGQPQ